MFCTQCGTNFPSVVDTVAQAHPASRIGLLHLDDDAVIRTFFGYSGSLVSATNTLLDTEYAYPNTKYFVLAGTSHTMLGQVSSLVTQGGVHLSDWLMQWVPGDPAWASAR